MVHRVCLVCLLGCGAVVGAQAQTGGQPQAAAAAPSAVSPDPKMPRPIDAMDSVFLLETVRIRQRIAKNRATISGIALAPIDRAVNSGRRIVEYRAEVTAAAIRKAIGAR